MNIFGWTKERLAETLKEDDIPRFRADQIIRWMYQRGAASFDVMDNLTKPLRIRLAEQFSIERPKVRRSSCSMSSWTGRRRRRC